MSVLHPEVAKRKFPDLVGRFREAQVAYATLWRLEQAVFPRIWFHLLNISGTVCGGLHVNAENWNHRPIRVSVTDPAFKRFAHPAEIPLHKDTDGQTHVYLATGPPRDRLCFCVPGTDEYHQDHNAAVPWESVRHLEEYDPVQTLARCVERIDRTRLEPIPVAPANQAGLSFLRNLVWNPRGP